MRASRSQAEETKLVELPHETGPVPVTVTRAEVRWFGVPPPLLLAGLAAAAFVAAVAVFAAGPWPYGLLLLGVAALLASVFLEVARRRPDSALRRASAEAAGTARERARAAADSLLARAGAVVDVQRIRTEQAVIESERRAVFLGLGEAVHREDDVEARGFRERLAELDGAEEALRARLAERLAQADERIRRARLAVDQTLLVHPEGGEGTPPRPVPVPEAYPPPDEGTQPYPPPDEGTPPTPAPVPEPSPDPDEDSRRPAA
jgi:hypothetical protein